MPIPKPSEDQSKDDFISECMNNETMKEEYEQKQRLAICYSSWRRSNENN